MPDETSASARDFLAAERTFLAWIRTGLALMGLGFVLARFGLFLELFHSNQAAVRVGSYGLSLWFGVALIVLGVLACAMSLSRYLHLVKDLERGEKSFARPAALAITVAVALVVLGAAMAIYLAATRPPKAQARLGALNDHTEGAMSTATGNGVVRILSQHSVKETVAKLEATLAAKSVKLFAIVDHSGEAEKAGLKMPDTKLLIFGNPKAGTPLMVASPSVALDLPLKILVAEDAAGNVWISYNAPGYLQTRHDFPAELLANVAVIEGLAAKASE
jgi:uncharacterized protein (DUF302 family)/uncharacterized membrane protein YidH (DUF202 family)